jgi:hypothetical protein
MPRWYNPTLETAPGLVVEFVRKWLNGDPAATRRGVPAHSWPWRASWAIGFALAERTLGLLGAENAIDEQEIEHLSSQVTTADGRQPNLWDRDGFRAGARAMLGIPPTASSVRRYLESGEAPVTTVDFPLLALSFGHRGSLSLPQEFFAASADEVPNPTNNSFPAALGAATRGRL